MKEKVHNSVLEEIELNNSNIWRSLDGVKGYEEKLQQLKNVDKAKVLKVFQKIALLKCFRWLPANLTVKNPVSRHCVF